jgi:alpha-D-xyloside xylohydrolase
MLFRIKAKGIKICVWINPYIAQRSPLFEEGKKHGYFLRRRDGAAPARSAVYQTDLWQAGMAIVDFSNPEATRWYTGYLEKLLDMGVDCFKTDFGERIPADAVYFDGGDSERHHNFYPFLYNKAVFELLERKRGKGQACLFARSATSGVQRFPVHWGGDCESTFEAMAETLRGGLSLGLSGFGFWSHDIGGFEGTPNAALFKRWLAFGLLSSHSRLHGSNSYRVPWNVDGESVEVCRFFTQLKIRLLPYILQSAKEANEKGIPVLRAMFLEFPNDPACAYLDRQYMLGPDLLVAPVFSEDGEVGYYLPDGEWRRFITGEAVRGGRWITEKHGFLSLPLLVRPNSNL